jgi:outer membrane protein
MKRGLAWALGVALFGPAAGLSLAHAQQHGEEQPPPSTETLPPPPTDDDLPRAPELDELAVQPGGLTADETARRALAASSSVRQKRAEIEAANARIRQTTIQFLPKLGLRASYTYLSEVEFPPMFGSISIPTDNYGLNAQLIVPLSDYLLRLSDAASGAQASQEAARLAHEAEVRKVQAEARILYYNWLRAHAQVAIAQRASARTRARLEDARAVFSVGRLAHADLSRIEALVANTELAVQQAVALRALIGAQLAIIMEDKGGGEYQVGQPVPEPPAAPALDAPEARRLIAQAMQNRLELKAIDAQARALGHGEDAVRASRWPRLDAVADFTYANPNPRFFPPTQEWNESWSLGVVASLNLEDPFMSAARGDEIAAQTESVRGQRRGIEAAITNEVVSAQLDIGKAMAALHASETSVRAAEESYRARADLFRVGRATSTELIDAETELLSAKLAATNARIDWVVSAERLGYAVGR